MKTPNEIIKTLAALDPIIQYAEWEECFYCQDFAEKHSPDCLWLEMQQIAQESKWREELGKEIRGTLEWCLLGKPLEEFKKEIEEENE